MKKIFAIAFGFFAAFAVFSNNYSASAAMINLNDAPANVREATNSEGSARTLARKIINFFLYFLGLIATGMVIYGGFLYITSGGEDGGVEKGKKILIYAAIGIILILTSFAIVNTLLQAGSGNEVI